MTTRNSSSHAAACRPFGDPDTANVWLIGHDPRLRDSEAEASTCFFLDRLDGGEPRSAADRAKLGLAQAVLGYIHHLTGRDLPRTSLYVTNLCNWFLPATKSGTVLIPDDVAARGAQAIAQALEARTAPPPVIIATSQQVTYHLVRLGLMSIDGGDEFVAASSPSKAAARRGAYVPRRSRAFLGTCGRVGFWMGSPVIPVLHVKTWQGLDKMKGGDAYQEPMRQAANAIRAALDQRESLLRTSGLGMPLARALAWQLGVGLARRHADRDLRLQRYYASLAVATLANGEDPSRLDLGFADGRCTASGAGGGPTHGSRDFSMWLRRGGAFSTELDALERMAGLPRKTGAFETTPRLLVLRVIAELLSRSALSKAPLDASPGAQYYQGDWGPTEWQSQVPTWARADAQASESGRPPTYRQYTDRWLIHESGATTGYADSLEALRGRRVLLDAERGVLLCSPRFEPTLLMPIYRARRKLHDVVSVVEDALEAQ